jgi:hypothetical protein
MVGYVDRRGYRVWDPKHRGIYPVRDVVFEEGTPRHTLDVDGSQGDLNVNPDHVDRTDIGPGDRTPEATTQPTLNPSDAPPELPTPQPEPPAFFPR